MTSGVAGRRVVLTLALSTTRSEACTWTVGSESLAYKITDDDGTVWSSADCPEQVPSTTVVVRRDLLTTFRLDWNGLESSRDCPASMDPADPGTYAVQAAAIGGEPSAVVPFELADPAELEPTTPAGPAVPKAGTKKSTSTGKKKTRSRRREGDQGRGKSGTRSGSTPAGR